MLLAKSNENHRLPHELIRYANGGHMKFKPVIVALLILAGSPAIGQGTDIDGSEQNASQQAPVQSIKSILGQTFAGNLRVEDELEIPDLVSTEDFASRTTFRSASLSPDGKVMSYIQSFGDSIELKAISPDTGDVIDAILFAKGNYIESARWVNDEKMLISVWSARPLGR